MTTYLMLDGNTEILASDGSLTVLSWNGGMVSYNGQELLEYMISGILANARANNHPATNYLAYIASEFGFLVIGERPGYFVLGKNMSKALKQVVKSEARLWMATWECLERLNSLGAWSFTHPITNPTIGLATLIGERQLLGFLIPSHSISNAATYLRSRQGENADLKKGSNPFVIGFTQIFTKTVLNQAMANPNFEQTRLEPMLKARTAVIAALKTMNPIMINAETGQPVDRRGRKPKNT
jgi:hypothetical protein